MLRCPRPRPVPTVLLLLALSTALLAGAGEFRPLAGLATRMAPGGLVVVQCNIFIGGQYSGKDRSKVTWETAQNFAKLLARDCPQAAVIGMEEVSPPSTLTHIHGFLEQYTHARWEYALETQGIHDTQSGLAVFWRPDRVSLLKRLGKKAIDYLDNGFVLRFMGVLLEDRQSGHPFGMFTGKLVWGGALRAGEKVDDLDRVREAGILMQWIRDVMVDQPAAPRIIAMDQNSGYGSLPFKVLEKEYESDGSKLHTHSSLDRFFGHSIMFRKLDYLWYDADSGAKKTGGFLSPAIRSEHFGSDHRAVWARLKT